MAHLRKKKGSPYWFACWKDGRRSVNRSTKETNKNKAAIKMARWAAEVEKSFHKNIGKITFEELANRWLEQQEPNLKLQTADSYRGVLNNRVLPYFKSRIVRDISPQALENFKSAQIKEGLSPRSVNYGIWLIRIILDYAAQLGYCHSNAAKLVRGMKQRPIERKNFSLNDLQKLFDMLEGQDKLLVQLAALCGLRRGELLGLKWDCVDFEKKTIEIRESYYGKKFGVDSPKNEGSRRIVLLPEVLVAALRSHRLEQEQAKRWHKGGKWVNPDLVFTTQNGDYLPPRLPGARILTPALKKAGLPELRFHDLRGIAATLMLESGASLEHVMKQGGWKTPAMVLSVYARVTKEAGIQAQENLQKYVFG